jgi:DNA-binding XRE family transcriptional regulator
MQGCVALLQVARITLKALKRKETDFAPQTLGDHIRKRRLVMGITQKEVAKQIGVSQFTLINWEKGRTVPPLLTMSRVIRFLGHDPLPPTPKTLAERLKAKRRELGWTQSTAARQLGVDPCTWADWETGGTIMAKVHRRKVAEFVGLPEGEVYAAMRKQWNNSHGRPTPKEG